MTQKNPYVYSYLLRNSNNYANFFRTPSINLLDNNHHKNLAQLKHNL